jgi:hypothetical protein
MIAAEKSQTDTLGKKIGSIWKWCSIMFIFSCLVAARINTMVPYLLPIGVLCIAAGILLTLCATLADAHRSSYAE